MRDYLHFLPEDFAQDDFFIHWVKSNSISAETFWQNWLETYPFKRNEVESARQLVLVTQNLPVADISDFELGQLKESLFDKINEIENKRVNIWRWIPGWSVAAMIAGILCMAGWYVFKSDSQSKLQYKQLVTKAAEKYDLVEVDNQTKTTRLVNLPDGSSVILKKGSRLSYPSHFQKDSREVYLTGEAFFEIAKDAQKPFYVYANEIITKVLGTSFNIKAYQNDREISVTVKTGKVSVYRMGSDEAKAQSQNNLLEGLVLSPNQQAVFVRENTAILKKQIESETTPASLQIDQMAFEYQEKPVGDIFTDIEKAYNVVIVYDSTVIGSCPVTASLADEPLNEKLKLLCMAVGAQYRVENGEILISGKGCE